MGADGGDGSARATGAVGRRRGGEQLGAETEGAGEQAGAGAEAMTSGAPIRRERRGSAGSSGGWGLRGDGTAAGEQVVDETGERGDGRPPGRDPRIRRERREGPTRASGAAQRGHGRTGRRQPR